MASQKQNPLRMIGEQFKAVMPAHSPGSHKELQGARVIEFIEQVPEIFQNFFKPYLSRGESLPYTILTSMYEASGETVTGKLVCAIDHAFYVWRKCRQAHHFVP